MRRRPIRSASGRQPRSETEVINQSLGILNEPGRAHGRVSRFLPTDCQIIERRGQPCPGCGGRDRFCSLEIERMISHCRRCEPHRKGPLQLVSAITGRTEIDVALDVIGEFHGMASLLQPPSSSFVPPTPCKSGRRPQNPPPGKSAIDIWNHAVPIRGTIAASYLLRRGLNPEAISSDAIRFCAPCFATRRMGIDGRYRNYPAMVARLSWPNDETASLQWTFLATDDPQDRYGRALLAQTEDDPANNGRKRIRKGSDGNVLKASPKQLLSTYRNQFDTIKGAGVWLVRNPASRWLIVGEGCETVLSVASCFRGSNALATIGTSGMVNLEIGGPWDLVIIAADNDPPGIEGANKLATRLDATCQAYVITLPSLDYFADWEADHPGEARPTKLDWLDALN